MGGRSRWRTAKESRPDNSKCVQVRAYADSMRVLISGAGIAGPTLAYWLNHFGFETTIVEKAPVLRTGGYMIDFWGSGFDVAERMDILEGVRRKGYRLEKVKVVDRAGRQVAGFSA